METVGPDIMSTCKDLGAVKKLFQLALLCTKKQPADRPTMHEVVRVLENLVPPVVPVPKHTAVSGLPMMASLTDYDEYLLKNPPTDCDGLSSSTSDANLFLKFGEVISQNTTQSEVLHLHA